MLKRITSMVADAARVWMSSQPALRREYRIVRKAPVIFLTKPPEKRVVVDIPSDYHSHNLSIAQTDSGIVALVRAVNYTLSGFLQRITVAGGPSAVDSENWIVRFDHGLNQKSIAKLDERNYRTTITEAKNGFEDPRIFVLDQQIHAIWSAGNVRSKDWTDVCNTMAVGRIEGNEITGLCLVSSPHGQKREKNWMPFVREGGLEIVYDASRMETYALPLPHDMSQPSRIEPQATGILREAADGLSGFCGSSQLVEWEDGYVFVVHYACRKLRSASMKFMPFYYLSQLVHVDRDMRPLSMSRPFFFEKKGTEFCAGLIVDADHATFSYSIDDRISVIARMTVDQFRELVTQVRL